MSYNPIEPDFMDYTGHDEYNAVFTVVLAELIDGGVFDWSSDYLNWKSASLNDEQYERICSYFIERFRYREISMVPFLEWALMLKRKLVYELMPKYKPLYERITQGVNPLQSGDEYHKRRSIDSDYPETLLSKNQDYISFGNDLEEETVKEGGLVPALNDYVALYHSVDELLLDELECMFIGTWSANANAL